MALLLFPRFSLVLLLIGLFPNENGFFLTVITTVNAAPNIEIPGPIIKIAIPPPPEIIVSIVDLPSILPCTVTINNEIFNSEHEQFDNIELHSWYRNDKKISLGRRSDFQLFPNGSLSFPANEKVTGNYRCLVNATDLDLGVLISTESQVKFANLKRIPVASSNFELTQGMYLVLHCPVSSIPKANITWFYEDESIISRFPSYRYLQLSNGTLIVQNITIRDSGKYRCNAENLFAIKKRRHFMFNVSVIINNDYLNKLRGQLLPPLQNELQFIESGKELRLRCLSYDDSIEWYFTPRVLVNGPNLQQQQHQQHSRKISNNSQEVTVMHTVPEKYDGFYNCSTKTEFQIFEVVVTTPPEIIEPFTSIESILAAHVSLTCSAKGNPPPEIIWYRNGIRIENSYTVYYDPPALHINSFDAKDDGLYQCFVKNVAGEAYSSGLVTLRRKDDLANLPRRPENIKCFPVNYNTLNVTFENYSPLRYMSIHFATENPYKWNSNLPIKLESNSYLIIDQGLPLLRPFMLYMRGLVQTSTQKVNGQQEQYTFDTSLLTEGVYCSTQGIPVNGIFFPNGIFIWWSHKFIFAKYFIIQFLNTENVINPGIGTNSTLNDLQVFGDTAVGTTNPINFYHTRFDIEKQLHKISVINNRPDIYNWLGLTSVENDSVGKNSNVTIDNESKDNAANSKNDHISTLIVPANVTGILIPNAVKAIVRILALTEENEHIKQNYSYVEWKTIENTTSHDFIFKISNSESRRITFLWNPNEKISCIKACYSSLTIEAIFGEDQEKFCQDITVSNAYFTVRKLKPMTSYRIDFHNCKTMEHLGSVTTVTKSDPPGTIRNQKISTSNGLKLSWDPPIKTNGVIKNYNVIWTVNNSTYEANITSDVNYFEFPNITENDKIVVAIRVAGDNGIGPPIFIDLRNVNTNLLDKSDVPFSVNPTLGIILGVTLSLICIFVFIYVSICQKRFKNRQPNVDNSQQRFGNESNYNTASPTSANTEPHEMQTLIPRYGNTPANTVAGASTCLNSTTSDHSANKNDNNKGLDYSSSVEAILPPNPSVPNGNGIYYQNNYQQHHERRKHLQTEDNIPVHDNNEEDSSDISLDALCSSTPLVSRKKELSEILYAEHEPKINLLLTSGTTTKSSNKFKTNGSDDDHREKLNERDSNNIKKQQPILLNKPTSSSPNRVNSSKGITSSDDLTISPHNLLQNGSIKKDLKLLTKHPNHNNNNNNNNIDHGNKIINKIIKKKLPNGDLHSEGKIYNDKSLSNSLLNESSQEHLLQVHLNSDCKSDDTRNTTSGSKNDTTTTESTTISDNNDDTTRTTVNMNDTAHSKSFPCIMKTLENPTWNFRRPIVDPNG